MAARESPAGKPVAGAAAQRPGPGPRAGPGRTAIRATPVRVTAGLDPATAAELNAGWAGAVVAAGAGFSRLPAAKAIRAMIRAATASTAVTSAVIAQLRQGRGLARHDAYRRRQRHIRVPRADERAAAGRPGAHRPA